MSQISMQQAAQSSIPQKGNHHQNYYLHGNASFILTRPVLPASVVVLPAMLEAVAKT